MANTNLGKLAGRVFFLMLAFINLSGCAASLASPARSSSSSRVAQASHAPVTPEGGRLPAKPETSDAENVMPFEIPAQEQQWRKKLTPEQFKLLRLKGTEPAWSGKYLAHKQAGVYRCAGCNSVLFSSANKFDSGSGWPSFWQAAEKSSVELLEDQSFGMRRVEVVCAVCKGHLGHLFEDSPSSTSNPNPNPTGHRY